MLDSLSTKPEFVFFLERAAFLLLGDLILGELSNAMIIFLSAGCVRYS